MGAKLPDPALELLVVEDNPRTTPSIIKEVERQSSWCTGTRWQRGRTVVTRAGKVLVYAPIINERSQETTGVRQSTARPSGARSGEHTHHDIVDEASR